MITKLPSTVFWNGAQYDSVVLPKKKFLSQMQFHARLVPQRLRESQALVTPLPRSLTRLLAALLGFRIRFLVCGFNSRWVQDIYKFYRFIENVPPVFGTAPLARLKVPRMAPWSERFPRV